MYRRRRDKSGGTVAAWGSRLRLKSVALLLHTVPNPWGCLLGSSGLIPRLRMGPRAGQAVQICRDICRHAGQRFIPIVSRIASTASFSLKVTIWRSKVWWTGSLSVGSSLFPELAGRSATDILCSFATMMLAGSNFPVTTVPRPTNRLTEESSRPVDAVDEFAVLLGITDERKCIAIVANVLWCSSVTEHRSAHQVIDSNGPAASALCHQVPQIR